MLEKTSEQQQGDKGDPRGTEGLEWRCTQFLWDPRA